MMTKTEITLKCIVCEKRCKLGETCTPKCEYIKSKMNSPFAQKLDDIDRVISFFGRIYDQKQKALSQPATETHK